MQLRALAVALVLLAPSMAAADPPGNAGGLFVVEDALGQFIFLKHHPEALAWRNLESQGAVDPNIFDHYQGLARNPRPGPPVFYVSQLDGNDGGGLSGHLHVVVFGSRDTSGERLRSNVQQIGNDTEEASPPVADTWTRSIHFDGTLEFPPGEALPAYRHPGNMALVDDVLFVPIDQPTFAVGAPPGQILLFDVAGDPTDPQPLKAFPLEHGIDNLAVTRLSNARYRIWTNGNGGEDINIYDTTHPELRQEDLGLEHVEAWDPTSGLAGAGWPTDESAHQSSTFLREPDGTLYLIGMRHPGGLPFVGEDFADLYRVEEPLPGLHLLTHLHTRQFNCVYDGGGGIIDMRVCNMTAASTAYVTPSGELILYSSPHDDENGFDPDIVRMGEFRHLDVNREGSPLRAPTADPGGPYTVDEGSAVTLFGAGSPPADRPWVELYDDNTFSDRSIVVDYDDRDLLELNEFDKLDDFTDKTTSVRWRSPLGLDIWLYDDDDFSDRNIVLRGTGQSEQIFNLEFHPVVIGVVEHFDPHKDEGEALDFNGKTSSLLWDGVPAAFGPVALAWDLDGDAIFGETGETGATPSFDASALDGPAHVPVTLRATVPTVAAAGESVVLVHVQNVPPAVTLDALDGGLAGIALIGVPVHLAGSFVDVPADTHTAAVDWGDGLTSAGTVHAGTSTVTATHVYGTAGDVVVTLTVTDDDGGAGSASAPLTVHDPISAIGSVLEQIDALLALPLSADDLDALQEARDRLDGRTDGKAKSGALDELDAGDKVAALVKLEAAIEALGEVESVDVSDLQLLLALAANSVARTSRNDVSGAAGPALDEIDTLIADGESQLATGDYASAVRSFRFATGRALELIG